MERYTLLVRSELAEATAFSDADRILPSVPTRHRGLGRESDLEDPTS